MKYQRLEKEDSEQEEDEEDYIINNSTLLPTPATQHNTHSTTRTRTKTKTSSFRTISFISISAAIAIALLFWLSSSSSSSSPLQQKKHQQSAYYSNYSIPLPTLPNHLKRISFDDALSRRFNPITHTISWLDEAGDGVYSEITHRGIILNDLNSNSTKILIQSDHLVDPSGHLIIPESFTVSSDLRYILVSTDSIQQWRHSKSSRYLIYDTLHRTVVSLLPDIPSNPKSMVSIAKWSPTGHAIAYVMNNDIYLITSPTEVNSPIRLTTSGTATVFNGICDWVYEEEVFSASEALWWSPDSSKIVWLSLDESHVPIYGLNIFNPSNKIGNSIPYPNKIGMKYPKPGFNNPIVSVELFDLNSFQQQENQNQQNAYGLLNPINFISQLKLESEFSDDERIVMEVAWVDAHQLIIRYINRIATKEKTGYFNLKNSIKASISSSKQITYGKLVMDIDFVQFDGGWSEPGQYITPIKANKNNDFAEGYLDIRINEEGFRHVAYFSPPDSNSPIFLSNGPWEVDGKILAVDFIKNLVYFLAANPSMERQLYSVNLPTRSELNQLKSSSSLTKSIKNSLRKITSITKDNGYFSASFSNLAGFYLLNYNGPGTPWQRLVKVNDSSSNRVVESNLRLINELKQFAVPQVHYTSINNSVGQEMNVQEIRPFNMDLSGKIKYPVLFKVYGGPNSQTATKKYGIDWNYFLSSSLDYLIVYVDGRGTGFKGRKFRVGVRNQLGLLESLDVSTAAQHYAGLKYVDPDRIGVWGWSYGGYLTCKTVESYSKDFSMALAVAPVTDWKFYDSVYTERYMSTPELNPKGYKISAINQMEGFGNLSFSLAHGSADDNVHFLNSAHLLDKLTGQHIHGFQFRLFPDSDHSISTRGAYRELMVWMTDFLLDRWGHGLSSLKDNNQFDLINNHHSRIQNKVVFNLTDIYSP